MGLNDRHFTSPDRQDWQGMDDYRDDVAFRQQLASVFHPIGPHTVQMDSGHTLSPITWTKKQEPEAIVNHRNDPDNWLHLPLGRDPRQWLGNLVKHLSSRETMERMRGQMQGRYGDE